MPTTSGTYEQRDGRPIVRFQRTFPHSVSAVWSAITDPAQLYAWFPTTVEFTELTPGAPITFCFETHDLPAMTGEIREVDVPRRFVFTWGDDELTFELADGAPGCELTFTVVLDDAGKAARDGAGWEDRLDKLALVAAGDTATEGSSSAGRWTSYYEEYKQRGFPATAEVPE